MTPNKRIALNIIATYGRSLYALVCGLFTARWVLAALGDVDYGLYGLVAGLVGFLSFINSMLAGAIGRFFAVAVGRQAIDRNGAIEDCRLWFTTAVLGNIAMALIIVTIGYPLGFWAVGNFLSMPFERISSCQIVWGCVCVTFVVHMIALPFNAMYIAKQYIAELTVYTILTTTLNVVFGYYMVSHPGDWLSRYAIWQSVLTLLPTLIIAWRAVCLFPECRFAKDLSSCRRRLREMLSFSGWNMVSCFGGILANQGCNVLINRVFGPIANAGINVGTQLSHHTEMLGGNLNSAFSPAIMNAYGADDYELMKKYVFRVNRLGTILMLVLALPMALEVDEVLRIWLGTPPRWAAGCCILAIVQAAIDKISIGHLIAINAKGEIARYQSLVGITWLFVLPMAGIIIWLGGGVYSSLFSLIIARLYVVLSRVTFARRLLGFSARHWLEKVLLPVGAVTILAGVLGLVPRIFMAQSFGRVCTTTCVVEVVIILLSWAFVLDADERMFILNKARRISK